ncbi:uncharacterized protein [Clytia hemisphaerica]|uniref:uncharacterized protein n=1 Tax=Clytia hemisphaerica TaxID=252671 RepID=UPI0034D58873
MDEPLALEKEHTIEYFRLFSTIALKQYLELRKKSTVGSFETLVARAFTAYEENVPVDIELEHRQRTLLSEYKKKFEDLSLSDPMTMKAGWVGEEQGIKTWPSIYFMDISYYYKSVISKQDLWQRVECEYKEGKAFRYFSNGFLGEVSINQISPLSKYCVLKAKCVPSQRLNNKQYDVWCVVEKKTKTDTGGKIMAGYCTCTAGLLGSCNHVAGLLFRVEAAVLQGITQETCTDIPSDWNRPKTKKQVKPGKLSNFLIKQDRLDKRFSEQSSLKKKKAAQQARINYNPAPSPLKMNIANKKLMRMKLFNATRQIVPQSTFIETYEGKEKPRKIKHKNTKHVETLEEIANKSITYANEKDGDKCAAQYINKIKSMTVEDMKSVCILTEKQSSSKVWFAQRKGRITASKFRRVYTKMNSLKRDENKDHTKLVSDLMGYIEKPLSDDMRFGISMEMHAKKIYRSKNAKTHKNLKVKESGLVILESHPWIGASPDLLVECDCHGLGLVEIKCPGSIRNQAPTSSNYKHLKSINGKDILNISSEYYCQIQGQMALTKRSYTDFFCPNTQRISLLTYLL